MREREKSSHSGQLFFEAHDPESLTRMVSNARKHKAGRIGFRDRICCYQWTWFTMVSRWLLYVWCAWGRRLLVMSRIR